MKLIKTRLIWILIAISISFVSCKKDEVADLSSFTFRDTVYTTDHGFIALFNQTETQSYHFILLCSPDMNYVENNFEGQGEVVLLAFISDSPTEIIDGLYVYDVNMGAAVYIHYDSETGDRDQYGLDPVLSSTADIKVTDNLYEIEYKLTLSTGEVLKGKYKGALESFTFAVGKNSKLYSFE